MKIQLIIAALMILSLATVVLADSDSTTISFVIDRTPPSVECIADSSLTNGGHGNWNVDRPERPDKDFQIVTKVSATLAPIAKVGYEVEGMNDYSDNYLDISNNENHGYPSSNWYGSYTKSRFFNYGSNFEPMKVEDLVGWDGLSEKEIIFAGYSSIRDDAIDVTCYAEDILGNYAEDTYEIVSTEVEKFCGRSGAKVKKETYFFCVDKDNYGKYHSFKMGEDIPSSCAKTTSENMNAIIDALKEKQRTLFCGRSWWQECVLGPSGYEDNAPYVLYAELWTLELSKTDGDCCAQQSQTGCGASDSRFGPEYNNAIVCTIVCLDGCGRHGSACVDYDSGKKIGNGCLKDTSWWQLAIPGYNVYYAVTAPCDISGHRDQCSLSNEEIDVLDSPPFGWLCD